VTINGIAPDRKNDRHRCTAGSNGLFMISVGVWGDLWSKEASNLDITGGTEEQDGKTEFLIWESRHELEKGDRLRFSFQAGDTSSGPPVVFRDKFERVWRRLVAVAKEQKATYLCSSRTAPMFQSMRRDF
jgi:hypothetical protein